MATERLNHKSAGATRDRAPRSGMTQELRNDIVSIILREAYGYNEGFIERWVAGKFKTLDPGLNGEDIAAMGAAQHIVTRIDARCSIIQD